MEIRRLTSLARRVDPRYPTNLAIVLLAFSAGALALVYQFFLGADLVSGFPYAFNVAAIPFLGWALAREIDPDRDYSAFLAAGLGLLGFFLYGSPSLLVLLLVLVSIRVINRTAGPPATLLDSLLLLGLGIFLTLQNGMLPGILAAGALFLDGLLPAPNRRNLLFAGLMALFMVAYGIAEGFSIQQTGFKPAGFLVLAMVTGLFIPVIFSYRSVRTVCDFPDISLIPDRVQAGMVFALLGGWLAWLLGAWQILHPVWMAIAAVAVYYLFTLVFAWAQRHLTH